VRLTRSVCCWFRHYSMTTVVGDGQWELLRRLHPSAARHLRVTIWVQTTYRRAFRFRFRFRFRYVLHPVCGQVQPLDVRLLNFWLSEKPVCMYGPTVVFQSLATQPWYVSALLRGANQLECTHSALTRQLSSAALPGPAEQKRPHPDEPQTPPTPNYSNRPHLP
jgi:hypothetical protein